jgi:rhodanese-related sulfurtransferase
MVLFSSVSRGIGEMDLNTPAPAPSIAGDADTSQPYLLLDVRDADEFDQCHIISGKAEFLSFPPYFLNLFIFAALNYPKAILSRAVNYESKEMLAYVSLF